MPAINVIGLGICQPPLLNTKALEALRNCDCIMGSPRQLASGANILALPGVDSSHKGNINPVHLRLPKLKQIMHFKESENGNFRKKILV